MSKMMLRVNANLSVDDGITIIHVVTDEVLSFLRGRQNFVVLCIEFHESVGGDDNYHWINCCC